MKRVKIQVYVSHFVATLYDKSLRYGVESFSAPYMSYKWEFNKHTKRNRRVPDKPFYLYDDHKLMFTFHISLLRLFVNMLGLDYKVTREQLEIEDHTKDSYGLPADIKFRDDKYTLRDYQEEVVDKILETENSVCMVNAQTGVGKPIRSTTLIRTPGGWTMIKDLKVNDLVIAPNGKYVNVTGVYHQGPKQLYRLTFADGRTIDAAKDHQWLVYSKSFSIGKKRKMVSKVVTTQDLIDAIGNKLHQLKSRYNHYYLPLVEPEDRYPTNFSIPPYVLGTILGCSATRNIVKVYSVSREVMESIQKHIGEHYIVDIRQAEKSYSGTLSIRGAVDEVIPGYATLLKEKKLLNINPHELFIPEEYFEGSKEQRYELLQGLMDVSGFANPWGNLNIYHQSKTLIMDIAKLVYSLGGLATMKDKQLRFIPNEHKVNKELMYGLTIKLHDPRKAITRFLRGMEYLRDYAPSQHTLRLRITDIERIDTDEATCISVDSPEQLYVADNYIVTHNTMMACYALGQIKKKVAICILPKYMDKWEEDLNKHFSNIEERYLVIQGGDMLRKIMSDPVTYRNNYDIFIFSMRTLMNYVNVYDNRQTLAFEENKYPIAPEDLMQALGIGVFLNDETHQETANISKLMLYFKTSKYILLTATFNSNDNLMVKLYEMMVPESKRIKTTGGKKNYVNIHNIKFFIERANKLKHLTNQGYSQILYEQSILYRSYLLAQYDKMILKYVERDYIKRRKPGQKLLIYCALVDMCKHVANKLKQTYPKLKISTYVQEDDYDNIMTSDISVSTPLSASTGLDIPNLITVIQTISMGSLQANVQMLGRLRYIEKTKLIYDALYCGNMKKHRDLYKQREAATKYIAKEWTYETYRPSPFQDELKLR